MVLLPISEVDLNGCTLHNLVIPPTTGSGGFIGQLRYNPATYVAEIWNGSTWIEPVSSGSLPAGTTDSMLAYNSTTGQWVNRPYMTAPTNKFKLSMIGSTTTYAELSASSTTSGTYVRLQTTDTKYALLSGGIFPNLQLIGDTSGSAYAIKVGNASVQYFTVTNQGNITANTLKLNNLGGSSVGQILGVDAANSVTKLSKGGALAFLGLENAIAGDTLTLLVSNDYATQNTDGKHFNSIDEAKVYGTTTFPNQQFTILVQAGTYSCVGINKFARVHCMPGVKITNSPIILDQGSSWTGHAEVSYELGSHFWIRPTSLTDTTPTYVEGSTIRVLNGCSNAHIHCEYLQKYVGCIVSDYDTIITRAFQTEIDCILLGSVYTTRLTDVDIDMNTIPIPPITNGVLCQCTLEKGVITCNQSSQCAMWLGGATTDMLDASKATVITIRCNKRWGQTFAAAGNVIISGLTTDWSYNNLNLPSGYVAGENTKLKLLNFHEEFRDSVVPYQVVNQASLVLDNQTMVNDTGGGCIVLSNRNSVGTDAKAYTSVSNCKLKSDTVELQSFGVNDAILFQNSMFYSSWGQSGYTDTVYNNAVSVPAAYWDKL